MTERDRPGRARDGRGRMVRSVSQRRKDEYAAELYERLRSVRKVAAELGISVGGAHERIKRGIHGEPENDLATSKRIALARLDDMAIIAAEVAREVHIAHSNGRVIMIDQVDEQTGEIRRMPLRDRLPNLQAIDRLQRIEDQRNRILGTYAPVQARVEVVPAELIENLLAENERRIRQSEAELGVDPDEPIEDAVIVETPTLEAGEEEDEGG